MWGWMGQVFLITGGNEEGAYRIVACYRNLEESITQQLEWSSCNVNPDSCALSRQ